MRKLAEANAVPFPDSSADTAAAAPIPGLSVGNKPAPGQSGPRGMAPRTNYSRVNTGSPTQVDAGTSSQKGAPPDTQNFLPSKIAHREVPMTGPMTPRTTLQELIKAAALGASGHVSVSLEAAQQLANSGESVVKTASAVDDDVESIPTAYVHKLAGACEFLVEDMRKHAEGGLGPGTGPNTMGVLEATSENNEFKSGDQGQATPAHVVPMTPGTHKPAETPAGPANALDTNAAHPVGGTQKTSGVSVEEMRKAADAMGGLMGVAKKGFGERAGEIAKGVGSHIAANKGKYLAGAGVAGAAGLGAAALKHSNKEASAKDLLAKAKSLGGRYKELLTGSKSKPLARDLKLHAGALPSAIREPMEKDLKTEAKKVLTARLATGGGLAALGAGGAAGGVAIAKHKKKESSALDPRLVDYFLSMTKSAEDAINPAQISAGAAVPPETSAAGEPGGAPAGGQPQGPTGLVGSNEAAINYTKGQAKAPMKSQLAAVVTEPALSAAHDTTLNKAWDETGAAGVKISHSLRHAAARAVLEKMAEAACAKETKKKVSAGMSNFTAPQVTGVAAGPM